METKIEEKYLDTISRLNKLMAEKNKIDLTKIIKKCESLHTEILKYLKDGVIKKTEIECFNWFDILIQIFENEKDAYLSKLMAQTENNQKNKVSKDYIVTQNKKRIYKIISKPIDYINKTVDYDYDTHYSILDQIDYFSEDASCMEHFPYKEGITELYMIFLDTPCDEIIEEAKNKNINCVSIKDLPLKPIQNFNFLNIDINVIIALCSDINFLDSSSEYIKKLIEKKIFIGFNIDDTSKLSNEEYCQYIQKEKNFILNEIKKYKKSIMCQSAYDETKRILDICATESEKNRLDEVIKELNIEIIDNSKYKCEHIEKNSINLKKKYNQVEQDVFKIGYLFNATTFTSNHRYIEFLASKNILINAIISPSLNLICQIEKKNPPIK